MLYKESDMVWYRYNNWRQPLQLMTDLFAAAGPSKSVQAYQPRASIVPSHAAARPQSQLVLLPVHGLSLP